jgi:hypothetical protein
MSAYVRGRAEMSECAGSTAFTPSGKEPFTALLNKIEIIKRPSISAAEIVLLHLQKIAPASSLNTRERQSFDKLCFVFLVSSQVAAPSPYFNIFPCRTNPFNQP